LAAMDSIIKVMLCTLCMWTAVFLHGSETL
jgi:hypothetical protein